MKRLLEALRKQNRVLLEMHLGMLVYGLVCWIAGSLIFSWRLVFTLSLWLGVGLAAAAAVHMHRSLDRALVTGDAAPKLVFRDYMFRYLLFALILLLVIYTKVLNPLVVFAGYMALKVSALLQPWTHKFCNRIFHETDPIPQPMPEEEAEPVSQPMPEEEAEPVSQPMPEKEAEPVSQPTLEEKTDPEES